jgi:hypothetical protein
MFKNVGWALRQYVENQPTRVLFMRLANPWDLNHILPPRVSGHESRTGLGH